MSIFLLVELPEAFTQNDELAVTAHQRSVILSLLLPLPRPPSSEYLFGVPLD
jgi:hypothetical protein